MLLSTFGNRWSVFPNPAFTDSRASGDRRDEFRADVGAPEDLGVHPLVANAGLPLSESNRDTKSPGI